ncbi:MAG: stage V sporulation protein E [Bacillota bacterium]
MARRKQSPDFVIFAVVMTLLAIGLVMVFSASSVKAEMQFKDAMYFLKRQLGWAVLGLISMLFLMNLDYWHLRRYATPIVVFSFLLLVIVLIPGIGREINGARRWVGYGAYAIQPSEMAKLTIVIYLAHLLTRQGGRVQEFWRGVIPVLAVLGAAGILIMGEPDLGTSVALAGTVFMMLFVAGARPTHLAGLAFSAVPVLAAAIFSADYRRRRFFAFLNPWADPSDTGYHIIQALYALGSGGLFGVGLGRSRQKLFYLPEGHTDFIFAILCEELGFIGAVAVLLLFFVLIWRGYKVAISAPDAFSAVLAAGLTTMIALQVIINIGVVTASLPITGIPLPFISSGGSSLVFTMMGVGVLLNISKYSVA